jgi:hypothetical protein
LALFAIKCLTILGSPLIWQLDWHSSNFSAKNVFTKNTKHFKGVYRL